MLSDVNIWHHRSDNARPRYVHLRRSSIGTVTIPPHIQVMADSVVSMSKKNCFWMEKAWNITAPKFCPNIWLVFMDFHWFSKLFPIFNADQRQENSSGEFNKQVWCWWASRVDMILVTSRKKTDHKAVELMDLMGMGFSMGQVINGILIFGEINILYQGLPAILGYHLGRVLNHRCGSRGVDGTSQSRSDPAGCPENTAQVCQV